MQFLHCEDDCITYIDFFDAFTFTASFLKAKLWNNILYKNVHLLDKDTAIDKTSSALMIAEKLMAFWFNVVKYPWAAGW